ncbi:MAG: hypothetical protein ACO2PN_12010 [Pyrobaculum sp.]|jgi:hypothetical protein
MTRRQFLTDQARALLIDRVVAVYDEMIKARDSILRITAAHKLIALAVALLSEREVALTPDLAYDWIEVLELIGITRDKLPTFSSIRELLAWRFHDSDEVDKFVKALYLLVPLFREAALISAAAVSLDKLH